MMAEPERKGSGVKMCDVCHVNPATEKFKRYNCCKGCKQMLATDTGRGGGGIN